MYANGHGHCVSLRSLKCGFHSDTPPAYAHILIMTCGDRERSGSRVGVLIHLVQAQRDGSVEWRVQSAWPVERKTHTASLARIFLCLLVLSIFLSLSLSSNKQSYEVRKAPADDIASGIVSHMDALSSEFVGTFFLTVAIHGSLTHPHARTRREGRPPRHSLSHTLCVFACEREYCC